MEDLQSAAERLSVTVRASPETNDHEVVLSTEHGALVERFCDGMIGLDPGDILVESCQLLPRDAPHVALIGRCDCGITGCGSVEVEITAAGDSIAWRSGERVVHFERAQYLAEVHRALGDFSWETADRTTARLISSSLDRTRLAHAGLAFMWASGRVAPKFMTMSFVCAGAAQVLLHVPWEGEPPTWIANECVRIAHSAPSSWSDVRWLPQSSDAVPPSPSIAGPGWRRMG